MAKSSFNRDSLFYEPCMSVPVMAQTNHSTEKKKHKNIQEKVLDLLARTVMS